MKVVLLGQIPIMEEGRHTVYVFCPEGRDTTAFLQNIIRNCTDTAFRFLHTAT
ncbi:MAG: hypothetical protein ACLVJ6_06720 [Merdibacter sp.]